MATESGEPLRNGELRPVRRCVVLTGISGSGKSTALHMLEDQGMYAVDNIPPRLLPQLLEILAGHDAAGMHGVAAVVDVRGGTLLNDMQDVATLLRREIPFLQILFLDAEDSEIHRRFETTRRRHPLADLPLLESIQREREMLVCLRARADAVIDTSRLSLPELREKIQDIIGGFSHKLTLLVTSFGFKYGQPKDCDYLFDVRFLSNPFYHPELRDLSGLSEPVREFVGALPETRDFLPRLLALLSFISGAYGTAGKRQVHVAVGCTGGRHRSVAIAEAIADDFRRQGVPCAVRHRDIDRKEEPL